MDELLRSARDGDLSSLQNVINSGTKPTLTDWRGNSALSLAAAKNRINIIKYLLEELHVPVSCRDDEQKTPLMQAVLSGNKEAVQLLLKAGAEVIDRNSNGDGVLTMAASRPDNAEVIKVLLDHQADVHERDARGASALMRAAQVGSNDVVALLLDHGARTNDHDDQGRTPLHFAAKHGYSATCEELLDAGAAVDAVDKDGQTPLMLAAKTGNLQAVRSLVEEGEANVDYQDEYDGKTALHLAAEAGFPDVVEYLLHSSANFGLLDKRNMTAQQLAEENLRTAVVGIFTNFKASNATSPLLSPTTIAPVASFLSLEPPTDEVEEKLNQLRLSPAKEALKEARKAKDARELKEKDGNHVQVGLITIFKSSIIGRGSFGTTVYRGRFQGSRECAVKEMSKAYSLVADNEIALLLKSDGHPNVIRYYGKEEDDQNIYLAVELCPASLRDLIERSRTPAMWELHRDILKIKPSEAVHQIMSGLQYLHSLGIVHRNIKPENILIAEKRKGLPLRFVLSDFAQSRPVMEQGLSKVKNDLGYLDTLEVCFPVAAAENLQWQPPEVIASLRAARIAAAEKDKDGNGTSKRLGRSLSPGNKRGRARSPSIPSSNSPESIEVLCTRPLTTKVDIFSAGCVIYYFLSEGSHPFGTAKQRRQNILENRTPKLGALDNSEFAFGEVEEIRSLVRRMIQYSSEDRPSARQVLSHVYFWSGSKKLEFLREAADRFKVEIQDPPSFIIRKLESKSRIIFSPYPEWFTALDKILLTDLAKNAKYDSDSVRDLLKAIRNLKNHYTEQRDEIKRILGVLPDGFLHYWTSRFPNLLMTVFSVVFRDTQLGQEGGFRAFLQE